MANRYIRHGATYCGDGTTSALATVNGGPGAWNDIAVFESTIAPAYGTLPAGTDVYIRTKDEAGNDITITLTAVKTLGSTAATEASPINWYFDDGDVWPGINGVVTYTSAAYTARLIIATFNNVYTGSYNLTIAYTGPSALAFNMVIFNRCITRKIKFDYSLPCSNVGAPNITGNATSIHIDPWFVSHSRGTYLIGVGNLYVTLTLVNPKIELLGGSSRLGAVFSPGSANSANSIIVYGGEIYGAGATSGQSIVTFLSPGGRFDSFGLKFPQTMDFAPIGSFAANTTLTAIATATACDGKFGNAYADYFCNLAARYDGYYPTLNASLSDSGDSPWSYALYPYRTGPMNPARVTLLKTYTQDPSIKTVTVNLLWPNAMAAPTSDQVWMQVMYYDATTGEMVSLTTKTKNATPLATNSALWSASTYGPTNFSKRQISIDTPTSIAKDTDVTVLLWSAPVAGSTSDIIIICPDVLLT